MEDDDEAGTITVTGLTKKFGDRTVVDDLSFTVQPGRVTGFLGANGAGKTTTLRMLLSLVTPSAGTATISGRSYRDLDHPARTVGALLDATGFHPGRTGRNHLRTYAPAAGADDTRVDDVLAQVGLTDAADRRVRGYSLGMRQRLGLATALLPDPLVLICDEPANGLDPNGIRWLRQCLREEAGRGRTVLVSSHLLSEMDHTVDSVLILDHGRLVHAGDVADVTGSAVHVRSSANGVLAEALRGQARADFTVGTADDVLVVGGMSAEAIGQLATHSGVSIWELRTEHRGLEDLFFAVTGEIATAPVAVAYTEQEPRR